MVFLSDFRERLTHLRAIYKEGVLGKWAGVIWLLLGIASTAKTEALSPALQEKWQFIHMIPTISLAWWVAIFAFLLFLWAVEASFQYAKKLHAQIERIKHKVETLASSHTTLKVDLHQTERGGIKSHRLGLRNQGTVVAKNVKVSLRDICPKSESFRNDFPYRVPKADAVWTIHSTLPVEDVEINPQEEELFHLATSWPLEGGFYVAHMDTKKHGENLGIRLARGQELLLKYEVRSANAPPIELSFVAAPDSEFESVHFVRDS